MTPPRGQCPRSEPWTLPSDSRAARESMPNSAPTRSTQISVSKDLARAPRRHCCRAFSARSAPETASTCSASARQGGDGGRLLVDCWSTTYGAASCAASIPWRKRRAGCPCFASSDREARERRRAGLVLGRLFVVLRVLRVLHVKAAFGLAVFGIVQVVSALGAFERRVVGILLIAQRLLGVLAGAACFALLGRAGKALLFLLPLQEARSFGECRTVLRSREGSRQARGSLRVSDQRL